MPAMSAASLSFHHVGVSVPDLDAAIGWYGDVLGFALEQRFDLAVANAKVAMIRRGDLRVELFEVTDALPLPDDRRYPNLDLRTHGNKHVAFRVTDLDAFLADVRTRGADVAMVIPPEFARGCFLRDCADNLIEFLEDVPSDGSA